MVKISQYLSTLGRWSVCHIACLVCSRAHRRKDNLRAIKESAPKFLIMVLGAAGGIGVAKELLSDKQGYDWLVNRWGSLNG